MIWRVNQISSLTLEETVLLIAHYSRPEKDPKALIKRGFSAAQIEAARAARKTTAVDVFNLRFTKPFEEFETGNWDYVWTLFAQFRSFGTLPFAGALSEQPNKIMEAFNLLTGLIAETERQAMKKEKLKGKVRNGR